MIIHKVEIILISVVFFALHVPQPAGSQPYEKEDLLVSFATPLHHVAFIEASRVWRRGVRAHFIVESSIDLRTLQELGKLQNETYTSLPHFPGHPVTIAQVLAPLYAFDAVGGQGFKWLLLGDADTVFVLPAILRLLNDLGLSADDPHIISDFIVQCGACEAPTCRCSPIRDDPRCLPCPDGARVCPCKLASGCEAARLPDRETGACDGKAGSSSSRKSCPVVGDVSAYGGAGLIYSIGMLRELLDNPKFYFPAAFQLMQHETPYSDVGLSELCRRRGYGFTRLPPLPQIAPVIPPGEAGELPFPERRFGSFSRYNDQRPLREQLAMLAARLQWFPASLEAAVSYHVRSHPGKTEFATQLVPAYRAVAKLLMQAHKMSEDVVGSALAGAQFPVQ